MPVRVQGYGTPLSRGVSGAAAGASEFFDSLLKRRLADQSSERILAREEAKKRYDEATQHVISGEWEPEQAAAYVGHPAVTADHFRPAQPSVEGQIQKLIGSITKAPTTQEVPGDQALAALMPSRARKVVYGPSEDQTPPTNGDEGPQADTLISPELQRLIGVRDEKLGMFEAKPHDLLDEQGVKQQVYSPVSSLLPSAGGQNVGVPFAQERTPVQEGQREGQIAETGAPGKGRAAAVVEDLTRPAKVQTTREEKQAGLDVENLPTNQQASARGAGLRAGAEASSRLAVEGSPQGLEVKRRIALMDGQVKQQLAEAGLQPSFADSFLHHGAFGDYAFVDASVPAAERAYIYKAIGGAAQASGVPVRFVNKEQENALSLIHRAYNNFNFIADTMAKYASTNAGARVIGGPANTLAAAMQTNPQLAAMVGDFPAVVEAAGAQMTGVRGLRMGKELIDNLKQMAPLATDTIATIRQKQRMQAQFLENAATSILQ